MSFSTIAEATRKITGRSSRSPARPTLADLHQLRVDRYKLRSIGRFSRRLYGDYRVEWTRLRSMDRGPGDRAETAQNRLPGGNPRRWSRLVSLTFKFIPRPECAGFRSTFVVWFLFDQFQGGRIDAEPQARWLRAIVEHMAEVRVAPTAKHFGAGHSVAGVALHLHIFGTRSAASNSATPTLSDTWPPN